jgi:hypothetical protein
MDISATASRCAAEAAQPPLFASDAVLDYIDRNRLYKDFDAG